MNLTQDTNRFRAWRSIGTIVVPACLMLAGMTLAQVPPQPPAPPMPPPVPRAVPAPLPAPVVEPEHLLKVIQLKNLSAESLASTVCNVYNGRRVCTADRATNSIILYCPEGMLEKVESLIATLEKSGEGKTEKQPLSQPKPETVIHSLKNILPDNSFEAVLRTALGLPSGQQQPCNYNPLAIDKERRLVVIRGERDLLDAAERVIGQLDQPAKAEVGTAASGVRIRIVWLMGGLKKTEANAPPADLKGIIEELAGHGITDLKLAAQMMVQATPGAEFKTSSSVSLDDPSNLYVNGQLFSDETGMNSMKITMQATRTITHANSSTSAEKYVELSTTVLCPPGRPTVLSVSPTDKATSVVVVQILPGQ